MTREFGTAGQPRHDARSPRRAVREAMRTVLGFAPIRRGRDWLLTRADVATLEASMRCRGHATGRAPRTTLAAPRGRAAAVTPQDAVRALLRDARAQRAAGKIALDRECEAGMTRQQLGVHRKLQELRRQSGRGSRGRPGIVIRALE